ncbi:MAG: hypothetical protein ABL901_07825 [Hyphomicrobiaceae bacterium]
MTGGRDGGGAASALADEAPGATRPSGQSGHPDWRFRRVLTGVALALIATIVIEQFELTPSFPLTRILMQTQDVPVLLFTSVLLLVLATWGVPTAWTRWALQNVNPTQPLSFAVPIMTAGLVVALGTKLVAFDFALTRDEAMAQFDAKIIASGHLIASIAPEWKPFVPSLQPEFRLPVPGDVAWVSSYLPVNAAIHAVLEFAFPAMLSNAILAVAALLALLGIARRIWPQRRDAWIVAVLLVASSSQFLFMAMTPYAMSAHLTCNLIWLWLFLRNSASSHVCATAVGFLATGLHQVIFHPLFVAPFLLQLLIDRRWKLGTFYVAAYAAIGVFWILYWQLLLASSGIAPEAASAMGSSYLLTRVTAMLSNFTVFGIETIVQNLLRFAAWQNPLLLVLLVPGMALAWTSCGILRALAGGILLTLAAMFILLPYQDIGWGYRYVHGLIGNAALLGALGWLSLTTGDSEVGRSKAWGIAAAITAAAVLILLPVHALQMRNQIAPYARAHKAITLSKADAVVVDTIAIYYGIDLVRNDPYLRERPLIFDIGNLNEGLVRSLCTRFNVSIFTGQDAARYGIVEEDPKRHSDYSRLQALRSIIESKECRALRSAQG